MAEGRIAVVGAGLAGLAAALELRQAGFSVEIFERSRLLGGRATSFEIDGCEVDNGQHVFLACCTEFIEFVERAGMRQVLQMQERFDVLVLARDGTASRLRAANLPAPLHLLASFLGYRHLGWRGKLDVARALACARGAARSHGSFAAWLERSGQGAQTLRAFWEPFFVPALNAPLDQVSAQDGAFVLMTAFLEDASAARFGFSRVPLAHIAAAAARRLDRVHLSTPVTGLLFAADARAVIGIVAGVERLEYDGVVLALPPAQIARLLGNPQRFGVYGLDAYEPYPIVDVHLWHDRGRLGFDFAALIDSPVQWVFEKGEGYLCCSLSAAGDLMRCTTAELTGRCWNEVCSMVPGLKAATLVRSAVTRNPEATFIPTAGGTRPGPRTSLPNLTIAGSWTGTGWPDTMESAVRSGRAAARALQTVSTDAVRSYA